VDLWLKKLESVAEIYNFSNGVKLSAVTSRLTKTVRHWFDLYTGSVNRSWITFRSALISHFKRKVLYSTVMQKVESRKWIFSKESFSDYAMDKLALMVPLKLPDKDSIQLLINGISSLAIKGTAVSLKIDSLDEFLRDMQHITATCNDVVKKSPTIFRKNKSKDQSPVLLNRTKRKSYSALIAVEETTSKKIATSSRGKSNQPTQCRSRKMCLYLR